MLSKRRAQHALKDGNAKTALYRAIKNQIVLGLLKKFVILDVKIMFVKHRQKQKSGRV
ncbi:MAG: hypothetical protein ACE5NL_00305 [Candidatus Hydrothermarchaeaceae archaeon]